MIQQSHSWAYYLQKTVIRKDTCTPMFNAALFTTARTWKPIHQEIKKLGYIYIYQAITKNKIISSAATWIGLEIIILSELSQTEKDKYPISLICGI